MNIESVTVIIVADGKALIIQPTPAQISNLEWQQGNGVVVVPDEDDGLRFAVRREFDGTGTFTLRIDGERAAVNGMWVDAADAPVVLSRTEYNLLRNPALVAEIEQAISDPSGLVCRDRPERK